MKKVFSGIQPSGTLTIGNYIGALKQFAQLQADHECIFSIVDLHAITQEYPVDIMPQRIFEAALDFLACGIDPEKSTLFVQSDRPEHTELAWLLGTITPLGELQRMTQFKEKSAKSHEIDAGLLNYPILMAADILIYKAEEVPVGEDQVQHLELTREIARQFNKKFACPANGEGETFPEPKPILSKAPRILGLDGNSKMSKSNSPETFIALSDSPKTIQDKVGAAVTDTGTEKEVSSASQNLFNLLEVFAGPETADKFRKQRQDGTIKYSELKPVLAEAIIRELEPIQKKRAELAKNPDAIKKILTEGAEKLKPQAQATLEEVKEKMGLKY
ncbi:MAG TPA: tryptophan--tRNA ligase [Patescibacteria group bacterium]|nr:tryptophan--tRNA ligase [Patescibacteria group bacterium]